MAFGITVSGGGGGEEFLPLLTYNSKGGRMKTRDRVEGANGWESVEQDLTGKQPYFVMDLANVMVGWLFFKAGAQPIKALVPNGQTVPPRPGGDFGVDAQGKPQGPKQGFMIKVQDASGTVREFSSNAASVVNALGDLHTVYELAPEARQGMLPVVQYTGDTEHKTKHGSNYSPIFTIVKWVARPPTLGGGAAQQPAHVPEAAAAAPF